LHDTKILHIPKQRILENSFFGERNSLNNKITYNNIYNNSKIKKLLPAWSATISFANGVAETLKWLDENPLRQRINPLLDSTIQELYKIGERHVD
jgi:hypothetical protein